MNTDYLTAENAEIAQSWSLGSLRCFAVRKDVAPRNPHCVGVGKETQLSIRNRKVRASSPRLLQGQRSGRRCDWFVPGMFGFQTAEHRGFTWRARRFLSHSVVLRRTRKKGREWWMVIGERNPLTLALIPQGGEGKITNSLIH